MAARTIAILKSTPFPTNDQRREIKNMYNLKEIMRRAWEIKRSRSRCTMATALRLAWGEAKGERRYIFDIENARASVSAYLVKLVKAIRDEHDAHKLDALKSALKAPVDRLGFAVLDGKTVGLCKYAMRNA